MQKLNYYLKLWYFWQRQCCTRRGFFTHTHTPKKCIKNVIKKPNLLLSNVMKFFSIWTNSIWLFVCALHKQNKQTKSRQQADLFLSNVVFYQMLWNFLAFGLTVFVFLYEHYTNKNRQQAKLSFVKCDFQHLNKQHLAFCVRTIYLIMFISMFWTFSYLLKL